MEQSTTEKKEIKRMPTKKSRAIQKLSEDKQEKIEWLIDAIEWAGLNEFMEYIRSPWKMLWPNFVAGIARGFWALVGVTIVITLIGWFLSTLIDLPLIWKRMEPYVQTVRYEFSRYTEATNYNDDFENLEEVLKEIRDELKATNK